MTYWIRAYNHKRYRVADFINDHGFIDWAETNRFEVGDVIFLYATAPESRITMMMEVEATGLDCRDLAEDSGYYLSQQYYEEWLSRRETMRYMRLGLLKRLSSRQLSLAMLREHGLAGAPRSPRRLGVETVDYIMSHL